MTQMNKENLFIIGATGFVGRRFCQYLLDQNYDDKLNLFFCARDLNKLSKYFPSKESNHRFNKIKLDTLNQKEVNQLKDAQYVANFAGPFDLYAEKIIAYCSINGIHYFDITGEFHFIKKMINKYDDHAKKTCAMIIPFSGFDSIPTEVLANKSIQQFEIENKRPPTKLSIIYKVKGGLNGGTLLSALNFSGKTSTKDLFNLHYLCQDKKKFISPTKTVYFPSLNEHA